MTAVLASGTHGAVKPFLDVDGLSSQRPQPLTSAGDWSSIRPVVIPTPSPLRSPPESSTSCTIWLRGLALSRQQLLDGVWEEGWIGDDRTVDVHVRQLRKNSAPHSTSKRCGASAIASTD